MIRSASHLLLLAATFLVWQPRVTGAQRAHPVARAGFGQGPASRNTATLAWEKGRSEGSSLAPGFSVRRLAMVAGGTALGAGLGYLSSQIKMSDWDTRARQGEGRSFRRRYSLGGAIAGATLGIVLPVGRSPGRSSGMPRVAPASIIEQDALRLTGGATAFDAVQSLRPRWLVKVQVLSLRDAVGDVAAAADDRDANGDVAILVYLNDAKMGGIESLRAIPLGDVQYIRFFTGPEATYKWGWGHANGVIQVSNLRLEQAR
ncbi:MAG: hypothetical protein ACYC3Q_03470 [Gemmatimonadaceae bacterium]